MKWLQSLPTHLLILMLLALMAIPAVSLVIHAGIQGREAILKDSARSSSYLVNSIATELKATIDSSQQLMEMLALLPEVSRQDSAMVGRLLADLIQKFPIYANIIIVDRRGISWVTAIPSAQPVSLADRKAFQVAKATGRFSAGEYVIGKTSQKPIINFAFPLKDTNGDFSGAVLFGVDLERIGSLLKVDSMPAGTSVAVYDHAGTYIYRTLDANRFIGTRDKQENFEKMQNGPDEGVLDLVSGDNVHRLSAYHKIRLSADQPPYAYIRGGTPVDPAIKTANAALLRNLAIMLLFLLAMFVASLWISRRLIVNRIAALEDASRSLANGDCHVKVASQVRGGELGRLAETFDAMAEKLVQRENALASSERFLNAIIDTEPECIKLLDEECNLLLMNPAGLQMIQADSFEQVRGKCVCPLISDQSRAAFMALTKQIFKGVPGTLEFETIGLKGRHVWLETHAVPFRNKLGEITALLGITRDITERKQAEQQLLELNQELELRVAERTAELEEAMVEQFCLNENLARRTADLEEANHCLEAFTAMVSHDLRAPLRRIANFSEILAETNGGRLDSGGNDLVNRIIKGCRTMDDLITGMLEFSRIDRQLLQKMTLDLKDLAGEVWREMQIEHDDRSVDLVVSELPPCNADRLLMKQVLVNLLGNAYKYTRFRENAVVEVGCELHEEQPVYFVRDNGAGFDMEYAANIFGLFQRLHGPEFEGIGVGLATSKRIIERHGGRIWAAAVPDQGATFYFTVGA